MKSIKPYIAVGEFWHYFGEITSIYSLYNSPAAMYDFKYIFERETPAVPPKGEVVWKKGEERERGIRINCRFLVRPCWPEKLCDHIFFNPLKGRSVNWLHFAIQV